jgi:hypothetical protein
MKIIAHRGNIHGPCKKEENTEEAISFAINMGFDCEIDVWIVGEFICLGHDYPEIKTTMEFLRRYTNSLWVHCKNVEALVKLKDEFNCFFHDKDLYTLTSKGIIWGNIGSMTPKEGVQVMPEKGGDFTGDCYGVCTDYPIYYKNLVM